MEISSFHQFLDESLNQALDRFHGLLRKTPTHGYSESVQLNIFIDGLRQQSKQLLDASAGGKIKLNSPEEAMELIENMVASDHAILLDRTYAPTKRSLLEFTTQDATLTQNKLLSRKIEALTETLSKLPQQLQAVRGCHICGGTHEPRQCIVQQDPSREVNYMGIPNRHGFQGYHQGGPSGFNHGPPGLNQGRTFTQGSSWKSQGNQYNKEHKKKAERPTRTFGANTEKNPKEECKAVLTRSQKKAQEEDEVEEDQSEEGRTNRDEEKEYEKKEEEGEKKEEEEKSEEKAQQ
ncbi:hypothetical protein GmHk_15G044993 [Glycine max]|nr:hypothetical protein GmHk_15G044993 [Glycine max]